MSRSRWKIELCCPGCFETGEAILSYAHDGPPDIRVEFLPPSFIFTHNTELPHGVDVICRQCNLSARRDLRRHFRRKRFRALFARLRKATPKLARKSKLRHIPVP